MIGDADLVITYKIKIDQCCEGLGSPELGLIVLPRLIEGNRLLVSFFDRGSQSIRQNHLFLLNLTDLSMTRIGRGNTISERVNGVIEEQKINQNQRNETFEMKLWGSKSHAG